MALMVFYKGMHKIVNYGANFTWREILAISRAASTDDAL